MSTRADAPSVPAAGGASSTGARVGGIWGRGRRLFQGSSLARRFIVANLAILLVAGVAVGLWMGDQLERGIVARTAAATGLYVESIIEPAIGSLAEGSELTPEEIATLDGHLATSPLADRVRSLRIWSPDGHIVYSPDPSLIGRAYPVEGHLAEAMQGEIVASMDDLSGAENAWERARWSRLLEIYIPVRERGSDHIMGVAEFYLPPREIDRQVADARLAAWAVVSIVIIASAALLFGIVKQGSDTIVRQEAALTRQVGELTTLVDNNAALSERVRTAAERTTTLNERSLRRVSSDLHDGPGQMLSLALMRLDSMRDRSAAGRPPTTDELSEVETVLREAMTDMRAIAAGLRMPELAPMGARAVAERAMSDHERRSGAKVELVVDEAVPAEVSLPVKIALFRALQEGLSNATRHGGGAAIRVHLGRARDDGHRLTLEVVDDGAGFDTKELETSEGLGLAGIREQAELLGGGFQVISAPGAGTRLLVWWPIAASDDAALGEAP